MKLSLARARSHLNRDWFLLYTNALQKLVCAAARRAIEDYSISQRSHDLCNAAVLVLFVLTSSLREVPESIFDRKQQNATNKYCAQEDNLNDPLQGMLTLLSLA